MLLCFEIAREMMVYVCMCVRVIYIYIYKQTCYSRTQEELLRFSFSFFLIIAIIYTSLQMNLVWLIVTIRVHRQSVTAKDKDWLQMVQ